LEQEWKSIDIPDLKPSDILENTKFAQADGTFYRHDEVTGCSMCAMGVLALYYGIDLYEEEQKRRGFMRVHDSLVSILRKFGVQIQNNAELIVCPVCKHKVEKVYLLAHLNNKCGDSHALDFKQMAEILRTIGW